MSGRTLNNGSACSPPRAVRHARAGLTVRVDDRAGYSVVRLSGELDLLTRPLLGEACAPLLARGKTRIVIDVAELAFCDCSGLNALIDQQHAVRRHGGALLLTGVHGTLARLLSITGTADTFPEGP
ncbi:STAS domain-containing protein [Nonomuraea sp. NPDC046802]|uniref:STAS domain-containing protein n=1 Tax=Nonomuraea sp. NPDC046802 TaxID=3154919 RepID=UPI0033F22FE2